MLAHVSLEVADLARSARFYDALMARLGGRRMHESAAAIAYGRVDTDLWIVARGRTPGPSFGHLGLEAAGRAAVDAAHASGLATGGTDAGAPAALPQYGRSYYAGYLLDPDGYRVELVSGAR